MFLTQDLSTLQTNLITSMLEAELEKHLKDPAYDEVKAKYFETLKNSRNSIEEVLNGSI